MVHRTIYLVALERLEDFDLVIRHVKWLYLDLVGRVGAHTNAPDVFKVDSGVVVVVVYIQWSHHACDTQGTCVWPLATVPACYDSINVIRVDL